MKKRRKREKGLKNRERMASMRMKPYLMLLVLIVLGLIWGIAETNWIRVRRYNYQHSAFSGLKIAFLSDFHYKNRYDGQKIRRAIKKVSREKPDLIILGGDYTEDDGTKLEAVFELLKDLKAPLGVYYITGNHDYLPGMKETLEVWAQRYGIQSLNNRSYWIPYNGVRLKLGGIPDMDHEHPVLATTLSDVTEDDFVILASHQPDFVMELKPEDRARIDLMLCGHTHGGQMTLFSYAPYIPSRYGQRFRSGRIDVEGVTVIVSNGVGETQIPLRYFAPAEVVLITFE